jgi:hypothetical protein
MHVYRSYGKGTFYLFTNLSPSKRGDEFLLSPAGTYIVVLAADGKVYSGSTTQDPTIARGVVNAEKEFDSDRWQEKLYHLREVIE